ncbi:putative chaperonin-like RbcX [Helianthus annuus]|nr:putative chaperonin-like RbcX [Helianthus annuus]KAJ0461805.1 putative chaperonin-like RbcX [Helianthus annuus]KAJ0642191.1 putative chaperonin-like RbcX [Helianthus annuus]KAJ0646082.1 putative chaperonin-like RbcX [Helianthus annuus]KAJ0822724.1 putative chaperonin-like RbcX [Helianthus annuus]
MIRAIAMAMTANTISYPSFGLLAESKYSLKTRKRKSKLMNSISYSDLTLMSSFMDVGSYARMKCSSFKNRKQKNISKLIVNELGGQYEEVFNDVKLTLRNRFTKKAVRTVLYQLYEMNPPQYIWLHNFIAENDPEEGKLFLRNLAKENQDLAERVMITRLHLYGKWIKQCDHGEIYKEISDENLELMRERLLETIVWPADDKST